jgi:hypothetical protein
MKISHTDTSICGPGEAIHAQQGNGGVESHVVDSGRGSSGGVSDNEDCEASSAVVSRDVPSITSSLHCTEWQGTIWGKTLSQDSINRLQMIGGRAALSYVSLIIHDNVLQPS